MRFTYNEQIYAIEFSRAHVDVENPVTGEVIKSKYPSTTVKILIYQPDMKAKDWPVYTAATVNCLPTDPFSLEGGRLYALKKVSTQLPYRMRVGMWEAYHNRDRSKVDYRKEYEKLKVEVEKLKAQLKEASAESRED